MSIWSSVAAELSGYTTEYPDNRPALAVDVAYSGFSPLIRVAAWPVSGGLHNGCGEFYVSREVAAALSAALARAVVYSRSFDEDGGAA